MGDLPEEIEVPTPSETSLRNVRFLPLTLETVTVYIDGNVYVNNGILTTQNNYRVFSNPYPLPLSSYSSVVFTSSGYDYSTLEGPLDENETYTITLHPAVAIPNITVNDSDYWETHKSEYNALIGNPVGTFKLDLSSYNTAADTLYAWTTTGYYDREDTSKPLTVYTHSENPSIDDKTYTSTGEIWDGKCYTGAEPGIVGTQISEISGNTITVGGMSNPTIPIRN